jgi:hypothetical protein
MAALLKKGKKGRADLGAGTGEDGGHGETAKKEAAGWPKRSMIPQRPRARPGCFPAGCPTT